MPTPAELNALIERLNSVQSRFSKNATLTEWCIEAAAALRDLRAKLDQSTREQATNALLLIGRAERADARVKELEAENSARSDLMQAYLDCWRNDKARAERADARVKELEDERNAVLTLTLTPEEIMGLVEFSGADEADGSEITVSWMTNHEGGPGWYAALSEYPEEGSIPVHLEYDNHNDDAAIDAARKEGK